MFSPSSVRSRFSASTFRLNGSRSKPGTALSRKISYSSRPTFKWPFALNESLLTRFLQTLFISISRYHRCEDRERFDMVRQWVNVENPQRFHVPPHFAVRCYVSRKCGDVTRNVDYFPRSEERRVGRESEARW